MEKEYTKSDLAEIQSAYDSYIRDAFDDWDTWLIELLQRKDWEGVNKELKRRADFKKTQNQIQ